jgi:protein subunit release factor B
VGEERPWSSSMVTFAVNEKKNEWLRERMRALGINERDLEEKFVKSAGRGGQKVNKTSSCVFLKHGPTGIEVKFMKDRSQSINRFLARRELMEKIAKLYGIQNSEDVRRDRIRKQKKRRRRRSHKERLDPK